ncbi:radical SAM/SPASM domain-containing protein [Thermococci archaeon]|nr:MAG: radical SAM/SPASM domain-containing protein [Thermococci archaeon]
MYKVSRYNLFFEENNMILLFNSLRNVVARCDAETKEILENETLDKLPSNLLDKMVSEGVIVDEKLNELNVIRFTRMMHYVHLMQNLSIGLTLVMTYSCNLACPYCYEGDRKAKGGLLTPNKIETILKFAKSHRQGDKKPLISVSFYGGEPLLNWKGCRYTLERLEEMKEDGEIRDYSTGFITNGTLINYELIEAINEYNVNSMQITLDGPREVHNKRRIRPNGEGTFDEIIENIKLLKNGVNNEKFHLGLRINVDKTNFETIPELLEFLKKEGLDDIPISYGIVRGNFPYCHSNCGIYFSGVDLQKALPYLWREAYRRGFNVWTRPNLRFIYCGYDHPFGYVIDPELKVYPCWEMVGIEEYQIGEIQEDGSLKIYPFYYDVKSRDPTEYEECRKCKLLPVCMGGCAAESIRRNGHPNGPGCDINKYIWKEGLKFYLMKRYSYLFSQDNKNKEKMI